MYNVPGAIYRHMLVSCRHGAAWLGKPDRGLPAFLVETLNHQIQAGHPTYLFLIDSDPGNRVMYLTELQAVSLKAPPEKGLVPGFYREMKMLSRMKAWLKIGDLEGVRLDEHPGWKKRTGVMCRSKRQPCAGVFRIASRTGVRVRLL